jgi:hypothetical protein
VLLLDVDIIHIPQPETENAGQEVLTGVDAPVYAMDVDIHSGWLALAIGSEIQVAKKISQGACPSFIRVFATTQII